MGGAAAAAGGPWPRLLLGAMVLLAVRMLAFEDHHWSVPSGQALARAEFLGRRGPSLRSTVATAAGEERRGLHKRRAGFRTGWEDVGIGDAGAPGAGAGAGPEGQEPHDPGEDGFEPADAEGPGEGEDDGAGQAAGDDAEEDGPEEHVPTVKGNWTQNLRPDIELLITLESIDHEATSNNLEAKGAKIDKIAMKFRQRHGWRQFEIEKDFFDVMPDVDWGSGDREAKRHRSCAIVGNSGVLRGAGWGAHIDAHEAVFRMNYAPMDGYQHDVGMRVTYDLCNKENTLLLARGVHRWRDPPSVLMLWEAHSAVIRRTAYLRLLSRRSAVNKPIWLIAPTVVSASRMIWLALKQEIEEEVHEVRKALGEGKAPAAVSGNRFVLGTARKVGPWKFGQPKFRFHNKPMSGMIAVFLAVQMCQSVDIYGFDSFTAKTKSRYHYFDRREGMTDVHSFDMAVELFRRIGKAFPLEVHSGKSTKRRRSGR